MKAIKLFAPDLLVASFLAAGLTATVDAAAAPLEVTVDDIRSERGTLLVQIVDGAAGLAGEVEPVASLMLDPATPSVSFSVDLAPGIYGMRVMQDLDEDMEMDANFVGIPTEPWAFSNNAVGRFGPPGWEDVRFEVTTSTTIQALRLVH